MSNPRDWKGTSPTALGSRELFVGCLLETPFRSHFHAVTHYPCSLCFSLSVQATDQDLQPNRWHLGQEEETAALNKNQMVKNRTGWVWM